MLAQNYLFVGRIIAVIQVVVWLTASHPVHAIDTPSTRASNGSLVPSANTSLLYIYRDDSFAGSGAQTRILIDGKQVVGHLPQMAAVAVELTPGEHSIVMTFTGVSPGPGIVPLVHFNSLKTTLTLEPGKTYFLKQSSPFLQSPSLSVILEEEARQDIARGKFVGKVSAIDTSSRVRPFDQMLRQIANVFWKIQQDYVDPVEDDKLVAACREGMLRQIGVRSSLPQAVRVDSTDPKAGLREIARMLDTFKKETPEFIDWIKLADACVQGLLEGLDKRSAYLDEDAFKELQFGSAPLGAIGLEFGTEEDFVKIVSTIEGAPAERAGLKSGDIIIKIDDASLQGIPLQEIVKRTRGKPGTTVRLTLARKGEQSPLQVELTREVISIQSVRWKMLTGGYLHIRISQFQVRTVELLATALRTAYRENPAGLRGVVLDLRNNPGGLLNACVGVSAAFLPMQVLVVETKGRTKDNSMQLSAAPENYVRPGTPDHLKGLPPSIKTVPMVVLVNHGSAACSEIVAGALQDHKRAKILGERTSGQGTVQTILPLGRNTAMKLTTARFFRPHGEPIESAAVTPDILFEQAGGTLPPFGTVDDPGLVAAIKTLGEQTVPTQR